MDEEKNQICEIIDQSDPRFQEEFEKFLESFNDEK